MENKNIEPLDVLGRAEEIERIVKAVEFYSANRKSISFAVQGEWGSGKTWILDRVFEELYDIQDEEIAGGRYCVLKYNAWDYDYYNEPLVSMLISFKKQTDSENAVFFKSENARKNYKAAINLLKDNLVYIGKKIPFIPFWLRFKQQFNTKRAEIDDKERLYNSFFDVNTLMSATIKGLNAISEKKTIVIIVDELDRCLPSYAIKVLERIHHISQRVTNIQFIYGVAKEQLGNSVKQIFGDDVDLKTYLSKFINFGLLLSSPTFTAAFGTKYSELLDQFGFINCKETDMTDVISDTLPNIPIRTREEIINKVLFVNNQLNSDSSETKLDFSILPMELFMAFCKYKYKELPTIVVTIPDGRLIELRSNIPGRTAPYELRRICASVCKGFSPVQAPYSSKKTVQIDYDRNEHSVALLFTYYLLRLLKQKDIVINVPKQISEQYAYLEKFNEYYSQLDL